MSPISGMIRYVLLRFVISLALMGLFFAAFVWYPDHSDLHRISSHVGQVSFLKQSLSEVYQRIDAVPDPATMGTGETSRAQQYQTGLAEIASESNVAAPTVPTGFGLLVDDEQVSHFSQITQDPRYASALKEAGVALSNDKKLLLHQKGVIFALANLLGYDPRKDLLQAGSAQAVTDHLQADVAGLEKTLERLGSVPAYSDPGVAGVPQQIHALQNTAQSLAQSQPQTPQLQAFADQVTAAQQEILAGRSAFWQQEKPKVLKPTNESEETLRLYLQQLNAL